MRIRRVACWALTLVAFSCGHGEKNEQEAIVDTCSIAAGQWAYREHVGVAGFAPLKCLADPRAPGCVPKDPDRAPKFLDDSVVSLATRHGYTRSFSVGPLAGGPASPMAVQSFCYAAVAVPGPGRFSFATDATGTVCSAPGRANLCSGGDPPGSAMPRSCNVFQCGDQGKRSPFGYLGHKSGQGS